jgi:hypothetical protein
VRRSICASFACIAAVVTCGAELRADAVAEARAALVEKYLGQLSELAEWCEAKSLAGEARTTRGWLPPERPLVLFVPLVDDAGGQPKAPDDAAGLAPEWRDRFAKLRQAQAAALFALVERSVDENQYAIGFELLQETLREDPEHEAARRLLGYKQHDGRWLTPFELTKAQGKQVWDARFGWLLKSQLARYENGERFFKGRWIKAEDDVRLHGGDIERGWEVMTEHYRVRTNHSLEEGVRLAARLERFYDVWKQVFVRYYMSDAELGKLLRGGGLPRRTPVRHQVTCFRNREEYKWALKPRQDRIGITTGYYEGDARTAYFFAGEEQDFSNFYHEATHQLFSETRKVAPNIGRDANFWIIEGVACYMESLVEGDGYFLLGGRDTIRLRNARTRLLEDDFYVPLAELSKLGMVALQRDRRISPLYSESSGLTYFLMYAQGGRYRDALVDYLAAIYAGRDRPDTLAELTQTPFADLDRQYREFLKGTQDDG